jgi:hypothetical protein
MTFSNRYDYNPIEWKEQIIEDAPEWLRLDYINRLLNELTYVDRDSRPEYQNTDLHPLGIKDLHEKFCILTRDDPESMYNDSLYCWEHLCLHIRSCQWNHFYDFIELVGEEIKELEQNLYYKSQQEWINSFGFAAYQQKLNNFLADHHIGWHLNDESKLVRFVPQLLTKNIEQVELNLKNTFDPAITHYKKAYLFLTQHPFDSENSIKEIVSAIESIVRIIHPTENTLGKGINKMKKDERWSKQFLDIMQKVYDFANSEPGVRHGGTITPNVQRIDADFCFHAGTSIIKYLSEYYSCEINIDRIINNLTEKLPSESANFREDK